MDYTRIITSLAALSNANLAEIIQAHMRRRICTRRIYAKGESTNRNGNGTRIAISKFGGENELSSLIKFV